MAQSKVSSIEEDLNERAAKRNALIEMYLEQVHLEADALYDMVSADSQYTDHQGRRISHIQKNQLDELRQKSHQRQVGWMTGVPAGMVAGLKVAAGVTGVFAGFGHLAPEALAGAANSFTNKLFSKELIDVSGGVKGITKAMAGIDSVAKGTQLVASVPETYNNAKAQEHGSDKQKLETDVQSARTSKEQLANGIEERKRKTNQKEEARQQAISKFFN